MITCLTKKGRQHEIRSDRMKKVDAAILASLIQMRSIKSMCYTYIVSRRRFCAYFNPAKTPAPVRRPMPQLIWQSIRSPYPYIFRKNSQLTYLTSMMYHSSLPSHLIWLRLYWGCRPSHRQTNLLSSACSFSAA